MAAAVLSCRRPSKCGPRSMVHGPPWPRAWQWKERGLDHACININMEQNSPCFMLCILSRTTPNIHSPRTTIAAEQRPAVARGICT